MNQRTLTELIRRYKSGQATESETQKLEEFWQKAANDSTYIDNLSEVEKEAVRKKMYFAISQQAGFGKESRSVRILQPVLYKMAAAFIVVALAFAWYLNFSGGMHEISTNYGERLTVILPDESSVVLNGNSTLKYSKGWSEDQPREVWIDGEGFFEVQHTRNHQKFIVHTGEGLNVEVLGTKFNVKSREHGAEVLLTEGKVKLNVQDKHEEPVYLNPGELATLREKMLSKRIVEDKRYTSWIERKLVFDQTPLKELAQTLEDTYGLQIHFEHEALKERALSGEISSATADDILFAIGETFNIKVTRDGNAVTFSSKD